MRKITSRYNARGEYLTLGNKVFGIKDLAKGNKWQFIVRIANKNYPCEACCINDIVKGDFHASSLTGGIHYCLDCVTFNKNHE